MSRTTDRAHRLLPWLVGSGVAVIHAVIACLRYAHFTYTSWDLTIFTQAINNYAHFRAPIATAHGPGFNVLGDHFSPILALLAPLMWIWQSPVMLLLAQALAFGLSAVPITRLARDRLGPPAGVALGIAYGLSAGLFAATLVDFHEIAFAVPLLAFGLVALVEERWKLAFWCSIPLLFVKEDLGFTVAAIGLLMAWLAPQGARRLGLLLAAIGVAGTVLAVFVLIPILAQGHRYAYFSQYDSAHTHDSMSAVWGALSPTRWTAGLTQKLHTVLTFGWATAFVGWASPIALLALPTFAWRFISAEPSYWGTDWHYDAVLMPIIFVAAIDTCRRWQQRDTTRRWIAVAAPAAALAVSVTFAVSSPLNMLLESSTWTTSPLQHSEYAAVNAIPPHVTVLSDIGLMSHLAARDKVSFIGYGGASVPQYIATVDGTGWNPPDGLASQTYWDGQYSGHQFAVVYSANGVTVLKLVG